MPCLKCLEVGGPVMDPCGHCGWVPPVEMFRTTCAFTGAIIPFDRFDAVRAEMKAVRETGQPIMLRKEHMRPEVIRQRAPDWRKHKRPAG